MVLDQIRERELLKEQQRRRAQRLEAEEIERIQRENEMLQRRKEDEDRRLQLKMQHKPA